MCFSIGGILLTSCLLLSATKSLSTAKSRNDNSDKDGANLIDSSGGWTQSLVSVTDNQGTTTISAITGRGGQEPMTRESDNGTEPHIKCPVVCSCNRDNGGRLEVLCLQGDMRRLPVEEMDRDTVAIVIRGPRNHIQLSAVLQPLHNLQVLRVTEASIPTIGKNTFWGVQTLQLLDLSRNNITSLNEDNFRGQDNLLKLNLSRNKLNRLPVATFRHLRELRSLSLAHNLIEELVQRIFFALVRLRSLDLSHNPFHDLSPDIFKDVQELTVFKCRHCRLENLNPMFYHLMQFLVSLDLGENRFKYFNREEFRDLKRLRVLRLDGNLLSVVVDNLFAAQRSLTHLDVSRNRLAKVANRAFSSLGNCTHLDLSYNKLSHLSNESMVPLKQLRVLNISGNVQMDLTDIKSTFQQVHDITSLSVADMRPPLPMGLLLPLTNLRSLNLSGNHMDNVSLFILSPISTLKDLDLSHNQISGIEESIAFRLLNIANVRLDNNPLICDKCHLGPLIEIVRLLNWKLPPICFFPDGLRGTAVIDLMEDDIEECVELIENEDLDAASTSYNFLESGNLSILGICIGVASGILFVLLILFTLVLSRRGNDSREETHHNTTVKTTRCQSSSSDVKTSAVLLDTKDNHERMFPETTERGRIDKYHHQEDDNSQYNKDMGREPTMMPTTTLGLTMSPINQKTTKQLKEVSFVFPFETGTPSLPPLLHCPSTHPSHISSVIHEEEDSLQLLPPPPTQIANMLLTPQSTMSPYSLLPIHARLMTITADSTQMPSSTVGGMDLFSRPMRQCSHFSQDNAIKDGCPS